MRISKYKLMNISGSIARTTCNDPLARQQLPQCWSGRVCLVMLRAWPNHKPVWCGMGFLGNIMGSTSAGMKTCDLMVMWWNRWDINGYHKDLWVHRWWSAYSLQIQRENHRDRTYHVMDTGGVNSDIPTKSEFAEMVSVDHCANPR